MMEYRLKKAFTSLYNQTFRNFELIVVDDASPDASAAVARKLMESLTASKLIANDKRKGLWASRCAGILAASGKYLLFLDPREWLESDALEKLVESIENSDVDLVQMRRSKFVGRVSVKSNKPEDTPFDEIIEGETYRNLARKIRINGEISPFCGDKLYRTDILREACVQEFKGNWGEVQILNIHYLRHARSMIFIDYAGVNVPWRDDFSNYRFSRLDDFKQLYLLKKILGQDSEMLKSELKGRLRYHIHQLLSELAWTPEAVKFFLRNELDDPIWKEVGEMFTISEIVEAERSAIRNSTLKNIATKLME